MFGRGSPGLEYIVLFLDVEIHRNTYTVGLEDASIAEKSMNLYVLPTFVSVRPLIDRICYWDKIILSRRLCDFAFCKPSVSAVYPTPERQAVGGVPHESNI